MTPVRRVRSGQELTTKGDIVFGFQVEGGLVGVPGKAQEVLAAQAQHLDEGGVLGEVLCGHVAAHACRECHVLLTCMQQGASSGARSCFLAEQVLAYQGQHQRKIGAIRPGLCGCTCEWWLVFKYMHQGHGPATYGQFWPKRSLSLMIKHPDSDSY